MSAAHRLPDPTPAHLVAQRGGLEPTQPAKMDFYKLQNHFWQLHAQEHFTGNQIGLYFYWLNLFNAGLHGEYWPAEYPRFGTQVMADLGMSDKTLADCRKVLESRGLLYHRESGSKSKAATWSLNPIDRKNSGQSATISRNFSGQSKGITPDDSRKNSDQSEGIAPLHTRKNSGLYKEKTEDSSLVEDTNKKNAGAGEDFSSSPQSKKEVTSPTPKAPAPAADDAGEARALATEMAALWDVTELRNFRQWAKFFAFTRTMGSLGRLAEAREQFDGYRLQRERRGLDPHRLDDWLGSETDGYEGGLWKSCHWPAKAAKALPKAPASTTEPAPARASVSLTNKKTNWS